MNSYYILSLRYHFTHTYSSYLIFLLRLFSKLWLGTLMSSYLYLLATENIFEIMFFSYSIAGTYFNQHHYIFSILNPCRRLSHLLGPFSDKHRIVHIYSHAFLPDIQYPCSFIFYRHRMHLFWHSLRTCYFKILRWFSAPKFLQLTWTVSVTHWSLGRSCSRLWVWTGFTAQRSYAVMSDALL